MHSSPVSCPLSFPPKIARVSALAALLLIVAGCGSGEIPLGSVSGRVTKAGAPQKGVSVLFEPAEGGRGSEGVTDAGGYYDLTFADRKGAILGKHRVTVQIKERTNEGGIVTQPAQKFLTEEREVQSGSNTFDFEIGGTQKPADGAAK
jgi:hypothetical protein